MKPSVKNLANLLIGKSAVCTLITSNFKEDRAFVITDVKVDRGLVYVKGKNTSWLTENVVDVFNIQQNKANIEVSDILDSVPKLKPATKTGIIKADEFDKIRDRIVAKDNLHPVGSWYYIMLDNDNGFFFVKLLSGWVVFDDVKSFDGNSRQTDLTRHLFTLTYKDYSPIATPNTDTLAMIKLKEAIAYFWIPAHFIVPIKEEVVEYFKKYSSFSEKKIGMAASFVIDDSLNKLVRDVHGALMKKCDGDFTSVLKKDIKAELVGAGLTSTQADFAVSLIKE